MDPTANDIKLFHETNVLGTARLASAASEFGVKQFIFLSSIKVNGESTAAVAFSATDTPRPLDHYGISKWQAEQKLFEIAAKSQMKVVAIRPPLVYGPGVRANFLRLLSWVHNGIPLPLGSIHNKRSLVSVWNLCDLIKRAIDTHALRSGVLLVSDGIDLSTPELIRLIARAMRRSPRLLSAPKGVLRLVGAMTGKSAEVARLCGSLTVDISATKNQLGWIPPVSVDEGLARTVRWFLNDVAGRRG
jgi:UDP-glucose 4-epimerase